MTHGCPPPDPEVADVVFLLDVDNTLLDNDRFVADLGARLEKSFGAAERDRYDPPPDLRLESIGDLLDCDLSRFLTVTPARFRRQS
jgi:hypothetical protein